jgi:hypothetical protein
VTPALAGAEEILAEIVRSLRALGGWRLEEAAALGPIEALWKIVGITTDNSAEVADFGTDVFVKVIEPLIALLIEARTRDKLPAEGVVAQIRQLAQGPLRRRLSRHDARLVTIQAFERAHAGGWFKRYPAETVAMIATMLEQVFGGGRPPWAVCEAAEQVRPTVVPQDSDILGGDADRQCWARASEENYEMGGYRKSLGALRRRGQRVDNQAGSVRKT